MKVIRVQGTAYRVHSPKWAFQPTSGRGAGTYGGRANRPGVDALYLSLDTETALAEYKQTSDLLPPGLIASYTLDINPVIDVTEGLPVEDDALWEDFYCDWRKLYFNERIEPPSWVLADRVISMGMKGIVFRSAITGSSNVVIYTGLLGEGDVLAVNDPGGMLPKNQASWE